MAFVVGRRKYEYRFEMFVLKFLRMDFLVLNANASFLRLDQDTIGFSILKQCNYLFIISFFLKKRKETKQS